MNNDTDTKTVDRSGACPGPRSGDPDQDPEAKSGTDKTGDAGGERVEGLKGERVVEKTGQGKIFKLSMWIGIPAVALVILLWISHNWLGLWLFNICKKEGPFSKPSVWLIEKLPSFFILPGILKVDKFETVDLYINDYSVTYVDNLFYNTGNEKLKERALFLWFDRLDIDWNNENLDEVT